MQSETLIVKIVAELYTSKHDYKNICRTGTTLVKALGDKYEFYELILNAV